MFVRVSAPTGGARKVFGLLPFSMASWADVVSAGQQSEGSDKISEDEIATAMGLISNGVVSLAEEVDPSLVSHWQFGLVGRFKSQAQPLDYVRRALSYYFGRTRRFELLPAPEGSFLIILESEDAMDWALNNGPWPIGGSILFLESWSADFDFSSEVRSLVPTWLFFPNLPKRLFTRNSLIALASLAGRPLLLDSASTSPASSCSARVRILCDLASPLPDGASVEVKGFSFRQNFKYGNLPKSCPLCGVLGHSPAVCNSKVTPASGPSSSIPPLFRGRSKSRRRRRAARGQDFEIQASEIHKDNCPEAEPYGELVVEIAGDSSPLKVQDCSEAERECVEEAAVLSHQNETAVFEESVVRSSVQEAVGKPSPVIPLEMDSAGECVEEKTKSRVGAKTPKIQLLKGLSNSLIGKKAKEVSVSYAVSEEVLLDKALLAGAKEGSKPVRKKGGKSLITP